VTFGSVADATLQLPADTVLGLATWSWPQVLISGGVDLAPESHSSPFRNQRHE